MSQSTSAWYPSEIGRPSNNITRTSRPSGASRCGCWLTQPSATTTPSMSTRKGGKDRFYTSPHLFYWLRQVDLSGCGTDDQPLRLPETAEIDRSQSAGRILQSQTTEIPATRWRDKKNIFFLLNDVFAEADGVAIQRHTKTSEAVSVACTPTVLEYTRYIGAIDLNDKMCRLDKTRCTYKWYVRVGRKCVAWALFNYCLLLSQWDEAKCGSTSRVQKMTENERATFVELLVMYQTGKGNDHLVTVLVPTDTHAALGRLCNKNTREAMGIGADNSPFHRDATSGW